MLPRHRLATPKGRGDVNLDPHLFEDTPLASGDLQRLLAKAQAAMQWRASIDQLIGDADVDGVAVSVTGSGAVSRLTITNAACADGGAALSQLVIAAVHAAQQDLSAKIRSSAMATFGESSDQAATVADGTQQRFGRSAVLIDTDFGDSVKWGDSDGRR